MERDGASDDDSGYFRERAAEEREAAAVASCIVKDVHLELAELYAMRAKPGVAERDGRA